jgi:hypothetical protein
VTSPIFSLGSPVYVRYKDHVLFKNVQQPVTDAVERETIGWVSKQTDELIIIEHDRTLPDPRITSGRGSGVIILKSCIEEIRELPLQKNLNWHLNSQKPTTKTEYAFRPTERKTHGVKDTPGKTAKEKKQL